MARRRQEADDYDEEDLEPPPPRRRTHRRRSLWWRRSRLVVVLLCLGAAVRFAPVLLVATPWRDLPLQVAFASFDGTLTSGGARWEWFGTLAWHDLTVRDREGRAIARVPHLAVDRGLGPLLVFPRDLGTVRLSGPEVVVEVRRGGSSLEDALAPWLAAGDSSTGPPPRAVVEVVDGRIELVDREHAAVWRIDDCTVVATFPDARAAGPTGASWTVAGRLWHAGPPPATGLAAPAPPPAPVVDRAGLAARATATLARDGGFSLSSAAAAAGPRRITAHAHRLPLGASALLAARFEQERFLSGRGDLRVEFLLDDAAPQATGVVALEAIAVCRADDGQRILELGSCDLPFELELAGGRVAIRRLEARSPLGSLQAAGTIAVPDEHVWDWAALLVSEDFSLTGQVDLAAVAAAVPAGLAVRPDLRLTGGILDLAASARADGADRVLEVRLGARDLAGVRGSAAAPAFDAAPQDDGPVDPAVAWREPLSAWLTGRLPPGRGAAFRIDEARIAAGPLEVSAAGTAREAQLSWSADLGRLRAALATLVDPGGPSLAGTSRGTLGWSIDPRGETGVLKAGLGLTDVVVESPGRPGWRDAEIRIDLEATGRLSEGAALLERAAVQLEAAGDTLAAEVVGGVVVDLRSMLGIGGNGIWLRPAPGNQEIVATGALAGDLGRWQARSAPWVSPWSAVLGGSVSATATLQAQADAWRIGKAGGEIERFSVTFGDRTITEPRIVATAAGILDPARGRYELSSGEVLSPTLSVRTGGLSWTPRGPAPQWLDALRGKLQWQADLGRLARWLASGRDQAASLGQGRAWGTAEVAEAAGETILLIDATANQIELAVAGSPAVPAGAGSPPQSRPALWTEPQAAIALGLSLPGSPAGAQGLRIDRLAIESSTLTMTAAGSLGGVTDRRVLELEGTVSWNWEQASRLLVPWTGGAVRLSGAASRPFAVRGPLLAASPAVESPARAPAAEVSLRLPESWLTATRGGHAEPARAARLTSLAPVGPGAPAVQRFRELALETSLAWQSAEVAGFPVAAGELPLRLIEGQLALGPFDLAVAGGRLRGTPWISLVAEPWQLVVPPGRLVERASLADPRVQRWIGRLSPLLGRMSRTEGFLTVDWAGGRLPLAAPFSGEAAGQLVFENLEVTPAGPLEPLMNLLVRLQSAADPRFAFGDKAVLLRVRPEPVRVALSGERIHHDGLVMDSGPFSLRSSGSVGADGSLAMMVEVALRADAAGSAPVVARLLRTPLAIPLRGTLERPQFDARAIDTMVARIVDNTAEAVLREGLGRGLEGLETLFGNPPPAEPSLRLPPPR